MSFRKTHKPDVWFELISVRGSGLGLRVQGVGGWGLGFEVSAVMVLV